MNDLIKDLIVMHRPGANRVPIPGILQDAPACIECGKASPCPTRQELNHHVQREALHDARNR